MSNKNNNCDSAQKYASIQQAYKKEPGEDKRKPVSFTTPIQAVYDGKTGASLEAILAQFNSIYVQYQGSPEATRNIIPEVMRRPGLTITYMDMEGSTITEMASSSVQKDNDHWGLDVNWSRVDELSLSGDISVSATGTWIINGEDTGIKAVGPKGDTGLTPWLKTIDNKLHFSYDNVTWEPCSENIAAWFRWNDNKIQISRDNRTWTDLSGKFADNLYIKGYVSSYSNLPANAEQGDIYGVGPTYTAEDTAHTNPIYRLHVWNGTSWIDNGQFTSIAAGVVQETGDSETEVMSQKAVTRKLSELGSELGKINSNLDILFWNKYPISDDGSIGNNNSYVHSNLIKAPFRIIVNQNYIIPSVAFYDKGLFVNRIYVNLFDYSYDGEFDAIVNVKTVDDSHMSVKDDFLSYFSGKDRLSSIEDTINETKEELGDKINVKVGKNLLNVNASEVGKYINPNNGATLNTENYSVSDYIPVLPSTEYYLSADGDSYVGGAGAGLNFYDSDKVYISSITTNLKLIETPSNAYYIRTSYNHVSKKDMQLNLGNSRGEYEPYSPIAGYPRPTASISNENQLSSILGKAACSDSGVLQAGGMLELTNFPLHCHKGLFVSLDCHFDSFNKIIIGKGYQKYRGQYLEIDNTNIVQKKYDLTIYQGNPTYYEKIVTTIPHGLTIDSFIQLLLSCSYNGVCSVVLHTKSGSVTKDLKDWGYQANYSAFVKSDGQSLTDVKFNATSIDFSKPVWAFGDSYFGVNSNRWVGVLKNWGYFNYLIDSLAGIDSESSYKDLLLCLKYGTPKYLLWCVGGNNYNDLSIACNYFDSVLALCKEKDIIPIFYTMPNMPSREYNIMNEYVKSLGVRYIDFAKAVGNPSYENGVNNWYNAGTEKDYLSADLVHPSSYGAEAMAMQVLVDFPELMQYGIYKDDTSLNDSEGDL